MEQQQKTGVTYIVTVVQYVSPTITNLHCVGVQGKPAKYTRT